MTLKAGVILTNFNTTKVLVVINKECIESGIVKYGLPKGHRDKDEHVAECAMRELREETSLLVRISRTDPKVVVSETTYFLVKASKMFNPSPQDLNEIGQCAWVEWKEVLGSDCNRGLRLIKRKLEENGSIMKRLLGLKPRSVGIVRKKSEYKQKENEKILDNTIVIDESGGCKNEFRAEDTGDDSSVDVP